MAAPEDEGVVETMADPSRSSSSGMADPEGVLRMWSFPRGNRLSRTREKNLYFLKWLIHSMVNVLKFVFGCGEDDGRKETYPWL